MAIKVENQKFYLTTEHTLYQMGDDALGVLYHLWYGEKTDCAMNYLLDYPDVGFSGNPDEAGKQRTYSMDTLPLEYAVTGNGDYRIAAATAVQEDGSMALDLRYEGYEIRQGKYAIPGLPEVHAREDQAQTLEIYMRDRVSGLSVTLKYGVLEDTDVITRSVVFKNDGASTIRLRRAHSMCLALPEGAWDWIHFHGRHTMERQMQRVPLMDGIQQIEVDQMSQVRMVMGIDPENFSWTLAPEEYFFTPEVILSCSTSGLAKLSQQFHQVIRRHVCRGNYQLTRRPVLINNWEATYFDFDEEKILHIAKQASELGIDLMVLDDGWFGKRDSDFSGLGDWKVNEQKLKGELPHRYVLGLYELLGRLTQEFPDVLFEGCSGGGGRFDAGMLYYCPQIWRSDDTDAHERSKIQYGTSFFYPVSAVGSHVSAVPNHQTGRSTSLQTRATVAMAGSLGYELDLNTLSEAEKQVVAEQVTTYKNYQELIYDGDYYRLSAPDADGLAAWAFVSQKKEHALVQGVIYRAASNVLRRRLRLRGLQADAQYQINGEATVYTGSVLMAGGILLPRAEGDDVSFLFDVKKIGGHNEKI